jgi:hypothetical protein
LEIKKAPGSQATEDALRTLEAKAMFDGQERTPAVRLAAHGGAIYLDIGDVDWRAIEITPDGWQIVDEPPVPFIRPRGMRPLPLPQRGGSLDDLRDLLNCRSEEDYKLAVGYLVAAMRPDGDYLILVLNGEQGSAKTAAARVIRRLIDPNLADTRTVPREERDLLIAARNGWIVSIDNLSEIRPWLSDALCRLATGGGFGARQLYTDGDEFLFEAKRPIIVNGIPDLATRPDLADRSLVLILPTITRKDRLPGSTFWTRFEERAPKILGALLDAVACALRDQHDVRDRFLAEQTPIPRMADAALWVEAAAPVLGWARGDFVRAFIANQEELQRHIVHADLVAAAVVRLMESEQLWEGNSTNLLKALTAVTPQDVQRMKEWPKAANSLSAKLRRAAPGLRMTGIEVNERMLDGKTIWTLASKIEPENDPTDTTLPTDGDARKCDQWDDLQEDSSGVDPATTEYDVEERSAIQDEPLFDDPLEIPARFDRSGQRNG